MAQWSGMILQRRVVRVKTCLEIARGVIQAGVDILRMAKTILRCLEKKKAPTGWQGLS